MPARKFIAAVFALLALTAPAHAATVNENFNVIASGFLSTVSFAPGSPVDPLTLNATINFDPAIYYSPGATGFTLNSTNFAYKGQADFSYSPTFFSNGGLLSINDLDGALYATPGTFDVAIFIPGLDPSAARLLGADYWPASYPNQFYSTGGTVQPSVAPLPDAMSLFGTGLLALAGFAAWSRRTARG